MNAVQRKRLNFIIITLALLALVLSLSLYALKQNINLFYTPSQIVEGQVKPGRLFRLGGQVTPGTLTRSASQLLVSFVVSDEAHHQVRVNYQGVLPDLFREGQTVVVEGSLDKNGIVQANQVLAKHDERYRAATVKR